LPYWLFGTLGNGLTLKISPNNMVAKDSIVRENFGGLAMVSFFQLASLAQHKNA
jgi:hypothetical protein